MFGRGCEGSALAPPARTKSVFPNLRALRALPDWAENHPATAFLALVHALALDTFFQVSSNSCLEITPKSAWLGVAILAAFSESYSA